MAVGDLKSLFLKSRAEHAHRGALGAQAADMPSPNLRQRATVGVVHLTTEYPNLILSISVLLFSIIAFGTMGSKINHINTNIDPIFYQSYIRDYKYMIEMFGYTYYSTRVSWIFFAQNFSYVFGESWGYFLSHLTFLSAGAISFAILVNRFFGTRIAIFAGAWFCFSPFVIRSFAHDYVDGPALAYGMAGMACVLTASRRAFSAHFLGGVAFALSFNAYPIAAVLPAAAVPAWFYLRRSCSHLNNGVHACCASAGFAFGYLLLALLLWHVFARAGRDFELIPLAAMSELYKGGASQWFTSLGDIFWVAQEFNRGYLLFAALGAISLAIGCRRAGEGMAHLSSNAKEGIYLAAILASMTLACFLWLHFWLQGGAIALPFAYVFAMPACGFASCALLHALCSRPNLAFLALSAAAVLIVAWVAAQFWIKPTNLLPGVLWLAIGSILAATGVVARRTIPVWLALVAAASIATFPLSFIGGYSFASTEKLPNSVITAKYVGSIYDRTNVRAEQNLRTGIFTLLDDAKALIEPGKVPGLWYKNGTKFADQVGSAFLWLYTRVSPTRQSGQPGLPVIDTATRRQLDGREYLILIDKEVSELERAKTELMNAGYRFEILRERSVGDEAFSFVYTILRKSRIDMAAYTPAGQFTFEKYKAQAGKLRLDERGAVHVETSDQIWAYAALYPVRESLLVATSAVVELEILVNEGAVGIGVSGPGGHFIMPETIIRVWSEPHKVVIPLKRADSPEWLVLRNVGRGKALFVVQSARTFLSRAE